MGILAAIALSLALALGAHGARSDDILVNTSAGEFVILDSAGKTLERTFTPRILYDVAQTADGRLYGVSPQAELFEIEQGTWRLTRLGAGRDFLNALAGAPDGRLLGAGGGALYEIDRETGAARRLMSLDGFQSSGDLAVLPDGTAFATSLGGPAGDLLYRIDLATLTAEPVGAGLGFHHVYGLAWSEGRLMGITEGRELIVIDPARGTAMAIGNVPAMGGGYGAAGIGEATLTPSS